MCVSLAASPGDDGDDVSRKSNAVFVFDVPAGCEGTRAQNSRQLVFITEPQLAVLRRLAESVRARRPDRRNGCECGKRGGAHPSLQPLSVIITSPDESESFY